MKLDIEMAKQRLDIYKEIMTAEWLPKDEKIVRSVQSAVVALISPAPVEADPIVEKKKPQLKLQQDHKLDEFFYLLRICHWRRRLTGNRATGAEKEFIEGLLDNELIQNSSSPASTRLDSY